MNPKNKNQKSINKVMNVLWTAELWSLNEVVRYLHCLASYLPSLLSQKHSKVSWLSEFTMDYLWIHTFLLRATLTFCYSFYNCDIPSNDTGLLLVGGAKTGISQSVEFWIPDRARSQLDPSSNENPFISLRTSNGTLYQASIISSEKASKTSIVNQGGSSIRCPTLSRGMWGHTTNSLPYGQGGTKCKFWPAVKIFLLPSNLAVLCVTCIQPHHLLHELL